MVETTISMYVDLASSSLYNYNLCICGERERERSFFLDPGATEKLRVSGNVGDNVVETMISRMLLGLTAPSLSLSLSTFFFVYLYVFMKWRERVEEFFFAFWMRSTNKPRNRVSHNVEIMRW